MRVGRKWAAGLVLAAIVPMGARADDASKREKLHEMFRLAHIDQTINLMFEQQKQQLPKIMQAILPGGTLTADEQNDLNAFIAKVQGIVQQQASWSKLEPQFTDIYASVYSEQEIDGMIAFYKSPVGQAMVAKQPEVVQRSTSVQQDLLKQIQPQLAQAMRDFVQQMQAKYGGNPPGAPTSPKPPAK